MVADPGRRLNRPACEDIERLANANESWDDETRSMLGHPDFLFRGSETDP
jgi:hypothetical protein